METSLGLEGALWGIFIGDALAQPIHWYYSLEKLKEHYGYIMDYVSPRIDVTHPDSWKYYQNIKVDEEPFDIFQNLKEYYNQPLANGYHQLLKKGENTLNIKVVEQLFSSILSSNQYDQGDFLNRYLKLHLEKGSHVDTYLDMSHRFFFRSLATPNNRIMNYQNRKNMLETEFSSPETVGFTEEDDCLAGIVFLLPLILHNYSLFTENQKEFEYLLKTHLWLTHPYPRLLQTAMILTQLLTILFTNTYEIDNNLRNVLYDTLKQLNVSNPEGYDELCDIIQNKELSDEDALKKCSMISNR
jgi:uncharacterized protein YutD